MKLDEIKNNAKEIIHSIKNSCIKSGRKVDDVKLVAVSKTVDPEAIKMAYDAGIRDFGENYVQEMLKKMVLLPSDINWHFIGHLQTNKIKSLIPSTKLIQTVYKRGHLEEIEKRAERAGVVTDLLVEVNIGKEDSKSGTDERGAEELVNLSLNFKHLRVIGLMCIPPISTPDKTRVFFKKLHLLKDRINIGVGKEVLEELSMGMSSDFEIAIEEGATIVRIGTAIFGSRGVKI